MVTRRRLGQNFLTDPNLLGAIVRESGVGAEDVVFEVGAGEGALSERLAARAGHLHAVEIDRRLEPKLRGLAAVSNVTLHWADAMKLDLSSLEPRPGMVVSNLPYSVATPLILRTIEQMPEVKSWTVMVQLEIGRRLAAEPGSRTYGAPSVVVQLAAKVEQLRRIDPAVFVPRPRVESVLLRLRRTGPMPDRRLRELVRDGFAHRRKSLARSLELARPGRLESVRGALESLGLAPDARAEALSPEEFALLSAKLDSKASD